MKKVRTETIHETKTKRIRVTEKNREQMLRAFNITIKDNKTGREIINQDTNIVLGVFNAVGKGGKNEMAIGAISVANCDKQTRLCAIQTLDSLQEENLKKLLKDTIFSALED